VDWLLVGLGNPGPEYARTRHNAGFMVLDRFLAARSAPRPVAAYGGAWTVVDLAGRRAGCLKPLTYMNRSGEAVARALAGCRLGPEALVVVHDDLDLALGQLRLRPRGGAGGHRGVESVIAVLGTDAFSRLRVGIGRPPDGVDPVEYVLAPFAPGELALAEAALDRAAEAVDTLVSQGVEAAMNRYNPWPPSDGSAPT